MYEVELDEGVHGAPTAGDWLRKSYRGGWCYLVPGKARKRLGPGVTADVNSLYPSVMHSMSGSRYPVGEPHFWRGDYIPDVCSSPDKYWFVRFRTRFHIKDGMLPCVQIKRNPLYPSTRWLETSDVWDPVSQSYWGSYVRQGVEFPAIVEMTMTCVDFKQFTEHYALSDFEVLDGCWFEAVEGVFDRYIDTYKKIKMESKGARREEAKLFLNNLYGKMASTTDSSFKVAGLDAEGRLSWRVVHGEDKRPGYIPVGSAITSYARNFTITAAQKNYHGPDAPGFCYADTDSIHCDMDASRLEGVPEHPTEFCHWKLESYWDEAWFTRQKTYIEHVTHEDGEAVEPWYNVRCAGMPQRSKGLFIASLTGKLPDADLTEEEREFCRTRRTVEDFDIGLSVPGKLQATAVRGGTVLLEVPFVMRPGLVR